MNAVILFDPYGPEHPVELLVYKKGSLLSTDQLRIPAPFADIFKSNDEKKSIDMGSSATLEFFLNLIRSTQLVSDQYILTFDGHGSAWEGFGYDTDEDKKLSPQSKEEPSFLNAADLTRTFPKILPLPNGKNKFDALVFISCLMGSLEFFYELKNFSEYIFSASQLVEFAGLDIQTKKTGRQKAVLLSKYEHYLTYNLKFSFLMTLPLLSTEEILKELLISRIAVEIAAVKDEKVLDSDFFVTYRGDEFFEEVFKKSFTEVETTENEITYKYKLSNRNYFFFKTSVLSDIAKKTSALLPSISSYIRAEKPDLFYPAEYASARGLGRKSLVDYRKLLAFLSENQIAQKYIPKSSTREVLALLDQAFVSAESFSTKPNMNMVAGPSVFLPSYGLLKEMRTFSTLNGGYFERLRQTQGILNFNEDAQWGTFLENYIASHTSEDLSIPKVTGRGFLRKGLR